MSQTSSLSISLYPLSPTKETPLLHKPVQCRRHTPFRSLVKSSTKEGTSYISIKLLCHNVFLTIFENTQFFLALCTTPSNALTRRQCKELLSHGWRISSGCVMLITPISKCLENLVFKNQLERHYGTTIFYSKE